MPRVLYVFEYPTLHGGEQSLLAILERVRGAGFEPLALAPPRGELAEALRESNVDVRPWEMFDDRGVKLPQAELRRRLCQTLRLLRPDLLHANSLSTSRLSGPATAEAGVPSIGHLRDILTLSRTAIGDVNRSARLLAVSAATRDWHVAQGLAAEKTYVCHNGVDVKQFRPRPPTGYLHEELALPRHVQLLASIGQIGPRKGLDVTAAAMQRLAPRFPQLHWLIVGERSSQKGEAVEYERRLREIAARPPLTGRAHFLGVRRDVARLLSELTLLVHASRQEPLGRVLLEAAAAGVPLVASDVGGTTEILPRSDYADLLTPPDDQDSLAVAVTALLNDPAAREQWATRLRRRAEDAFQAAGAAERLLEHYGAVLSATA
ncbi:MAG: glycosyltransferase family 4 protein [Planctomycetes bacterium]|nr:glycosyltransferase family 4 protein [Planctomycetota bacterium]